MATQWIDVKAGKAMATLACVGYFAELNRKRHEELLDRAHGLALRIERTREESALRARTVAETIATARRIEEKLRSRRRRKAARLAKGWTLSTGTVLRPIK